MTPVAAKYNIVDSTVKQQNNIAPYYPSTLYNLRRERRLDNIQISEDFIGGCSIPHGYRVLSCIMMQRGAAGARISQKDILSTHDEMRRPELLMQDSCFV
jgi:hypothetical protein